MSWKGIKRAAVRAPHLVMGNKSNDAIFASLEKEFTHAMTAVDKIITETKNFRDGWTRFLTHQIDMTTLWTQIYGSIPTDSMAERNYYETPASTISSIESYTHALMEVRETLLPILNGLDGKVVEPSMDMKKALEGVQKMVKKRHHKKMDYDRFTSSVEKLRNKKEKTDKDQVMLQKMEGELEVATQEFQMHDERMKELIPSIMESISMFFSPILNTLYSAQIDLYQNLYAAVHEYATTQGLTNTATVVEDCQELWEPIRQRTESEVKSLREGKVARTPVGDSGARPGIFGRKSSTSVVPPAAPPPYSPPVGAKKSSSSLKPPPPPPPSGPSPVSPGLGGRQSYNSNAGRTPSSSSLLASDVKKKKPPPPPPPKPSVSPKPEVVVAKYDFAGESPGDLAFRTGDRIKIIKKTDSVDDWWEGELNGVQGSFPRNYCD